MPGGITHPPEAARAVGVARIRPEAGSFETPTRGHMSEVFTNPAALGLPPAEWYRGRSKGGVQFRAYPERPGA